MSKKRKSKKKSSYETTVAKLVLITAILEMLSAFLDLIRKLLE